MDVCVCVCVLRLKLHIGDGLTHLSTHAAGPMREKEQNSPEDTNVATQITRRRRPSPDQDRTLQMCEGEMAR